MPDDLLIAIDAAFAERTAAAELTPVAARVLPLVPRDAQADDSEGAKAGVEEAAAGRLGLWTDLRWMEIFLAIQFLWGALIFIPGSQPYRGVIRALPYVSGLGLMGFYMLRSFAGSRPRGGGLLVSALLLLVLNLLQPTSQLSAGIAQCVFQLSIAAPLFWAYKSVDAPEQLERLLVFVFLANLASAGLGILQVYYPDRFMPPQFSTQFTEQYLTSLSYMGNDGRLIVRPSGLSDTPGGAALAGSLTALLGLGLSLRKRKPWQKVAILGAIGIGLDAVYLTQVRSLLLMAIVSAGVLGFVAFRRGRVAGASWILVTGSALLVASFLWASSVGGTSISNRFIGLKDTGALQTFQAERGGFLNYTLTELLDQFPFGAGVGRWGMMNTYFGDAAEFRAAPIHVEIQLTGWLLDGGWPMWLLYGSAILMSLLATFKLTASRNPDVAEMAMVVLALQVFIAGMTMAGPVFNTQLGVLFWTLAALLHGVSFFRDRSYS